MMLSLLGSCKFFKKSQQKDDDIALAKVEDQYLYLSDISPMLKNVSKEDSANFVISYTQNWARKKLLEKKAEENISAGDIDLEEKVAEYRQSLLLYEYEKELINQKLDNAIPESEVAAYYEKYKTDFRLEADIYLTKFIRISKNAEGLEAMKPVLLTQKSEEDILKAKGYCKANGANCNIDGAWFSINSLFKEFPVDETQINELVASKKAKEFTEKDDFVFLSLLEKKAKGEQAPMGFVKESIKELLVNKKKVELIDSYYNKIFEEGVKDKSCEIFIK